MKEIKSYEEIKDRIVNGINSIADPVKSTITPKGSNVIIQAENGVTSVTNDGATIAKYISVDDPISQSVIDIIKHSALQTNDMVGDGTSTSILLSQVLIINGFTLIEDGWNGMKLSRELESAGSKIIDTIKTMGNKIRNDKDIKYIADVSANNDAQISNIITKSIKYAGDDGIIMLDENNNEKTVIENENGFLLASGLFSQYLSTFKGKISAHYKNVKVLVTDKRIYDEKEALAIMEELIKNGHNDLVIVAKDFIGNAPNVFITNHQQRKFNVLLVKSSDPDTLEDLAIYLGTQVVSDKKGKLTLNININDFGTATRVISDMNRTLFLSKDNIKRKLWIEDIKEQLKKNDKNKELKNRLSRMTSGTVNIKVGASTPIELREKLYRYEDAISAVRVAQKEGYVEGGGISIYKAFDKTNLKGYNKDIVDLLKRVCETPLKQIAINCGIKIEELLDNVNKGRGYNAISEKFENLTKAGIIEPVSVVSLSFKHALSVAKMVLSSKYFIINYENKKTDEETNRNK